MAFPPNFLEELRQRLSITDIVGRRVRLIRKGREASGLCPFHNEKTPSFTVSEEKGFYHCFGCGAHGDVIGFVMQSEGLEFLDAVEKLAAEAGLEVPKDSPESRARAERQASLASALEVACKWFEEQLRASAGRAGLDYLKRRGLADPTMRKFRLGYAPDSRHALKAALEKASIPEALSVEAGLLIKPEDGGHAYDRFRGRVMFPILNPKGQVIGFGGRALGDEQPKYLNSPETPLFHKGRVLYGLSHAQKSARDRNEIIVVEGYMDVIALSEAGFTNAVAPLGTALTEDQIQLLWRFASEPILCFDGDSAGERAAARGAERALPLLKPGLSLRFAWMPDGDDPDSLVRSRGPEGFRACLEPAEPLAEVTWRNVLAGRPLDTPERRSGFRKDLLETIGRITDKSVYGAYRQEIETRLNALYAPMQGPRSRPSGQFGGRTHIVGGQPIGGQAARRGVAVQRVPFELVLAVLVNHPEMIHRHCETLTELDFPTGDLDRVKRAVIDLAARHPQLEFEDLRSHLGNLGFAGFLEALAKRTGHNKFTLPSADTASAEEGLLHVMGLLKERQSVKAEVSESAKALQVALTDEAGDAAAETALMRFEVARQMKLEGESQRRDLDRDKPIVEPSK